MAYIYTITNKINGKQYVGKTDYKNPENRFKEHLKDRLRFRSRPLYRAMNKYGVENFCFEILEETLFPVEREIFWIEELQSYGRKGYNATKGGEGVVKTNHSQIVEDYLLNPNAAEIARLHNCDRSTVVRILRDNDIELLDSGSVLKSKLSKKVDMLSLEGELLRSFPSQIEAGRYLITNNLTGLKAATAASSKIGLVCRGKRVTFANFKWRYGD